MYVGYVDVFHSTNLCKSNVKFSNFQITILLTPTTWVQCTSNDDFHFLSDFSPPDGKVIITANDLDRFAIVQLTSETILLSEDYFLVCIHLLSVDAFGTPEKRIFVQFQKQYFFLRIIF